MQTRGEKCEHLLKSRYIAAVRSLFPWIHSPTWNNRKKLIHILKLHPHSNLFQSHFAVSCSYPVCSRCSNATFAKIASCLAGRDIDHHTVASSSRQSTPLVSHWRINMWSTILQFSSSYAITNNRKQMKGSWDACFPCPEKIALRNG